MKKLLILMLVLGMASLANATVTYQYRDAAGTTPISVVNVSISTNFTVVVSGLAADMGLTGGVYDNNDWFNPGGLVDFTGYAIVPNSGTGSLDGTSPRAGNLANITHFGTMDGYTFTIDDLEDADATNDPESGDFFVFDLSVLGGATSGSFTIDILDSGNNDIGDVGGGTMDIVPEPMTIALLGLGGLLLRRRKGGRRK